MKIGRSHKAKTRVQIKGEATRHIFKLKNQGETAMPGHRSTFDDSAHTAFTKMLQAIISGEGFRTHVSKGKGGRKGSWQLFSSRRKEKFKFCRRFQFITVRVIE